MLSKELYLVNLRNNDITNITNHTWLTVVTITSHIKISSNTDRVYGTFARKQDATSNVFFLLQP